MYNMTESSITLNFPDSNFFRFEDCKGYKDIQDNFKEMDVCWYEEATNTLYIIELKDWKDGKLIEETDLDFPKESIIEKKSKISISNISILVKKSLDSVSMFMSMLLEKPYSATIQACSPFTINKTTKIKLLSIINWTSADQTYISVINSAYKSKFKPYAKLYDIKTFVLMTKQQAMQAYNWIS